jgi:hypothetical protein
MTELDEVLNGITGEERQCLESELDLDASEKAWEQVWGPLSNDQREVLARRVQTFSGLDGPVLLTARRTQIAGSPGVFARFACYSLLPSGPQTAAGWFLSGYLAYKPTEEQIERWRKAGMEPLPPRRVYITRLAIEPEKEGQELKAVTFRAIKVDAIIAKVRAYFRVTAEARALLAGWGVTLSPADLSDVDEMVAAARRITPKRGASGFPDDYYYALATDYLEELDRGRGVHGRLAKLYGQPEAKIRDHLNRAKRAGWLEGGGHQGKLSYRPGPRLTEFRADEREEEQDG